MIINQIYNIGNVYFNASEKLGIMLNYQNPVKPFGKDPKALVMFMDIDLSHNPIEYNFQVNEFDYNREKQYLLGLNGGNAANFSLTLNPGWKANLKDSEKQKLKNKFWSKIIAIKKNEDISSFLEKKANWILEILKDIEKRQSELFDQFENYLIQNGYTVFNYPLICRIKRDTDFEYLGDISEMVQMYQFNFFPKIIETGDGNLHCRICGTDKMLTEAFKLGMYSTTQEAFVMGFFSKYKEIYGQNVMCTECFLKTLLGFNKMQEKLNFYAYSLKNGKLSDSVYHFIIPLAEDKEELKQAINIIGRAKKRNDDNRKTEIQSQIQNINEKLKQISDKLGKKITTNLKEEKQTLKNEQKKLQSDLDKQNELLKKIDENDTILDMELVFDEFNNSKIKVALIDIYYFISNVKQNPKTIEVVSDIMISSENIEKLASMFQKVSSKFNKVRLSSLQALMEEHYFLEYYSALLSLKPISLALFNKRVVTEIKQYFLSEFLDFTYFGQNPKIKYYNLLNYYEYFKELFQSGNLWRN